MSKSLLKYCRQKKHPNGQMLLWNRADEYGAPFRGREVPSMTEAEAEDHLIKVADAKVAFFNVATKKGRQRFIRLMDRIVNGWFKMLFIQRFVKTNPVTHYVEWIEYYLQDGRLTKPAMKELEII